MEYRLNTHFVVRYSVTRASDSKTVNTRLRCVLRYGFPFLGFVLRWLGVTRARDPPPPLFLAAIGFRSVIVFVVLILNGVVSYAAPNKAPGVFSPVRCRVNLGSGSGPAVKKRVPPLR